MLRIWNQFVIMETFLLTLVRHGETAENKLKIVQGHTDTKLAEIGIKQAALVGQCLENETFTHIFSSDLSRAHETCKIILEQNKASNALITLDSRLRERKLGVLEGQSHLNCYNAIKTNRKNLLPGVETKTEVRERAKSFFRELCRTVCEESSDPHKTSSANSFQCPCNKWNCKCPASSATLPLSPQTLELIKDPCQESLCNVDNAGKKTSNHLNNGASPPLENLPDKTSFSLESSSDEEHLGITPDVLQLGRQLHPGSGPNDCPSDNDGISEDHSSALNLPWVQFTSSEGFQGEGDYPLPQTDGNNPHQHHQLANVLLVSHGGFLLELINYFFKELKCKKPLDGIEAAASPSHGGVLKQSIMSNAGLSRFIISINTRTAKPTFVSCMYLNDRKHLSGEDVEEEEGDLGCHWRLC